MKKNVKMVLTSFLYKKSGGTPFAPVTARCVDFLRAEGEIAFKQYSQGGRPGGTVHIQAVGALERFHGVFRALSIHAIHCTGVVPLLFQLLLHALDRSAGIAAAQVLSSTGSHCCFRCSFP